MNGDPQHEEETPSTPKKPEKEKDEKPADDGKAAKEGSCGGSAS